MVRFIRKLSYVVAALGIATQGCAHKNQDQQQMMAPPPGWNAAPPQGAVVAPAPSGCNSCAGANPVVNAPRYSPPTPAAPPMNSAAPPLTSATPGLTIGTPVSTPHLGPIQAAFTPTVLPIESVSFGALQIDQSPAIPTPPNDKTEDNQ